MHSSNTSSKEKAFDLNAPNSATSLCIRPDSWWQCLANVAKLVMNHLEVLKGVCSRYLCGKHLWQNDRGVLLTASFSINDAQNKKMRKALVRKHTTNEKKRNKWQNIHNRKSNSHVLEGEIDGPNSSVESSLSGMKLVKQLHKWHANSLTNISSNKKASTQPLRTTGEQDYHISHHH
jgi:hypothetical protein